MSTPVQPYVLAKNGTFDATLFKVIASFSSQDWDNGVDIIEKTLDKTQKHADIWNTCFDFCRLSKKSATLDTITSRYATIFNKPPPEWISKEVESVAANKSSGLTLSLSSVSTPESEQYGEIHKTLLDKKTALLIKFTPGKPLSWQETGVQRLAAILNDAQKLKVPVFGEHIELPLIHIKKMPADARQTQDWDIMFFCLKLLNKETEFEEEALNYAMAKGMSPPTYAPFPKADKAAWFSAASSASEDDINNPVIMLSGALTTSMSTLQQRVVARLQTKPAVILDLRGLTHIDFTSAVDLVKLHEKVWASNARKLFAVEPSIIIMKTMLLAGWPATSFQTMPAGK